MKNWKKVLTEEELTALNNWENGKEYDYSTLAVAWGVERGWRAARERDELLAEVERLRRLLSGAVVYDTGAAVSERAIHKRLVEMGWTPPEEQNV